MGIPLGSRLAFWRAVILAHGSSASNDNVIKIELCFPACLHGMHHEVNFYSHLARIVRVYQL